MHIISRKALRVFWAQHPDSQEPLSRWFKIMRQTQFRSFVALRRLVSLGEHGGIAPTFLSSHLSFG